MQLEQTWYLLSIDEKDAAGVMPISHAFKLPSVVVQGYAIGAIVLAECAIRVRAIRRSPPEGSSRHGRGLTSPA
jgi:hypothetical protein